MAKKGLRRTCPRKGGLNAAQHNAKNGHGVKRGGGITKTGKKKCNFAWAKNKEKVAEGAIPHGLQATDKILLVGEGNFSFARSLVRLFENNGFSLHATSYDPEEILHQKYEDAADIISEVEGSGASCTYGVDGGDLLTGLGLAKRFKRNGGKLEYEDLFDTIIFNFPHCGLGIKDQDRNVKANQELLGRFFGSSMGLLRRGGEVRVTIKTGKPYSMWGLQSIAHRVSGGRLKQRTSHDFHPEKFPGYKHQRTLGYKEGQSSAGNEEIQGKSRTYVWALDTA